MKGYIAQVNILNFFTVRMGLEDIYDNSGMEAKPENFPVIIS